MIENAVPNTHVQPLLHMCSLSTCGVLPDDAVLGLKGSHAPHNLKVRVRMDGRGSVYVDGDGVSVAVKTMDPVSMSPICGIVMPCTPHARVCGPHATAYGAYIDLDLTVAIPSLAPLP